MCGSSGLSYLKTLDKKRTRVHTFFRLASIGWRYQSVPPPASGACPYNPCLNPRMFAVLRTSKIRVALWAIIRRRSFQGGPMAQAKAPTYFQPQESKWGYLYVKRYIPDLLQRVNSLIILYRKERVFIGDFLERKYEPEAEERNDHWNRKGTDLLFVQ